MGLFSIGLIGHVGGGKTSLAEAMLLISGTTNKLGSVDEGTSVLDYDAAEKERKTSLHSSLADIHWRDHTIELLDAPGSMNFIGDSAAAMRVIDAAVVVSSAEPGVQAQTEILWDRLDTLGVPRMLVINKLDREQADYFTRLAHLTESFGKNLVPLTLPWGEAENFRGVINLVEMQAYECGPGGKSPKSPIPDEMKELAAEGRSKLIEAAAEGDDELMEKFLETEQLDEQELLTGLLEATRDGKIVPVVCTSATQQAGVECLMQAMVSFLPDFEQRRAIRKEQEKPEPGYAADSMDNEHFSGLVFKTKIDHFAGRMSIIRVFSGELKAGEEVLNANNGETERPTHLYKMLGKDHIEVKSLKAGEVGALPKLSHTHTGHTLCNPKNKVEFMPLDLPEPVLTYALLLSGKGEEEKVSNALHRMIEEDPTLSYHHNAETGDFLLSGMGQIHLTLVLERLKKEFQIEATFGPPHVPYRETIRGSAKSQGRYKKQTGGRGQFGDCWLELKPNGHHESLTFNNKIVGGAIPKQYIPAVEKGIVEAMHRGIIAGFPVIGIDATVYDGSYHDVDSSEMAFKIAGSMAFKKAMEDSRPVLLEPVLELEIFVAPDYTGDVMGDINARRGKVLGMETRGRNQVVRAEVPMGESLQYAVELRQMTSGQGYFTQKFSHYEEVPAPVMQKVIAERQQEAAD